MRALAILFSLVLGGGMLSGVEPAKKPKPGAKAAAKKKPAKKSAKAIGASKQPAAKGLGGSRYTANRRYVAPRVAPVSPRVRATAISYVSNQSARVEGSIENPAALVPFFEMVSHPSPNGSLHILQFGDSHTAADDWTNAMRQGLQAKFGTGGAGFALAGHPYRGYRRYDLSGGSSPGWEADGMVGHPGDERNGLGGISMTAHSAGETVSMSTECADLELYYLQQPGGGQLEFSVDGVPLETISTDGELGPGYFRHQPAAGPHQYTLRTLNDAPVRLFGWVAQNQSGVTYETLGINGAQATMLNDWDESLLTQQVAQRDPVLIVLAYGTNEALSPRFETTAYRAGFSQVVERFRRAAPTASILVIGPPDCLKRYRGKMYQFPHMEQVIEIQRQVAYDHGCAFWDWRAHMGGPGSVRNWVLAGLSQGDYVHFTGDGYRKLGSMILDEMMTQYNRFLAVRTE